MSQRASMVRDSRAHVSSASIFAVLALLPVVAHAQRAEPPELQVGVSFRRLGPNVVVLRDSAFESNMTVIRTSAGLVVVDNFMHRVSTSAGLRIAADSLGERRITLVINTHGHDDHTWGNQVFRATDTPPILAHAATVEYMRARTSQMELFRTRGPGVMRASQDSARLDGVSQADKDRLMARARRISENLAAHEDLVVTPPTHAMVGDTAIVIGSTSLHIIAAGKAHTDGDVVVVVPDEGVIVVGDLALTGALPGLDPQSGSLVGWANTLRRLSALAQQRRLGHVVPGHGPLGDLTMLRAAADYFTSLLHVTRAVRAAGGDIAAVRTRLPLPSFALSARDSATHAGNIEAAWLHVARETPGGGSATRSFFLTRPFISSHGVRR
jgi:cyclase